MNGGVVWGRGSDRGAVFGGRLLTFPGEDIEVALSRPNKDAVPDMTNTGDRTSAQLILKQCYAGIRHLVHK